MPAYSSNTHPPKKSRVEAHYMSQSKLNENLITWTFENYATAVSLLSGLAICALIYYIYSRSGSLIFLRDLMWRFFGGTIEFENTQYEKSRKKLRETEHYRFEFNIPVSTLEEADLAEKWIAENNFSHRDIARITKYIHWGKFEDLRFKTKLFSKKSENIVFYSMVFFLALIVSITPFISTNYLRVSLKNAPDAPSFYLSESNIKFELFPDNLLTTSECSSSATLEKFIQPNLPEEKLDIICSLFLDPKYVEHVKGELRIQTGLILFVILCAVFAVFCLLIRLTRLDIARNLHNKTLS